MPDYRRPTPVPKRERMLPPATQRHLPPGSEPWWVIPPYWAFSKGEYPRREFFMVPPTPVPLPVPPQLGGWGSAIPGTGANLPWDDRGGHYGLRNAGPPSQRNPYTGRNHPTRNA